MMLLAERRKKAEGEGRLAPYADTSSIPPFI
jgi:hypothetical protein